MHVDGGATAQLFLYPPSLSLRQVTDQLHIQRERNAYIIRNARVDPNWSEVRRQTLSIAGRAVSALIQTQGIGDLYRLYLITQRDGVKYHLAAIPSTFREKQKEAFDPIYMTKLFDVGYQAGLQGGLWQDRPPGLHE
jgi:hypothetical protein